MARCRTRFPVPVILFRGRYVCRSATLSGGAEIYGRTGLESIETMFYGTNSSSSSAQEMTPTDSGSSSMESSLAKSSSAEPSKSTSYQPSEPSTNPLSTSSSQTPDSESNTDNGD